MKRRSMLAGGIAAFASAALPAPAAGELAAFAAASLKTALDAIAAGWQRDSGKRALISYAASSTLARQIENGAPAGLFISADLKWMDYLQQRGLVDAKT